MRLRFLTYCFITWAASTSCVDPYDFKGESRSSFLVVDGRITQLDEYNSLRLSWSTPYGETANLSPVDNAQVKIYNSKGESAFYFNEGDGQYGLSDSSMPGIVGESYYIEISLGNKIYRSVAETMQPPVIPDSVTVGVGYKDELNDIGIIVSYPNIDVFIHTPINQNGNQNYIRWRADEVFSFFEIQCHPLHIPQKCFAGRETSPEKIKIYSGEKLGEGYLADHNVGSKRILDWSEFVYRHYFNVYQYSLTKEAYDYWDKLSKIAAPKGDIFDLPPATVIGNIYNVDDEDELVGGYFEAASIGVQRKFVTPGDLRPFNVPPIYEFCDSGICCNCSLIYGANLEQPDYWD